MIVLATGHQVRCILVEQMAIFNKGIGFVYGLKLLVCFRDPIHKTSFVHDLWTLEPVIAAQTVVYAYPR